MPQLEDIEVDFVSLVDKSAVRDPADPTRPRSFLLYKAEGTTPRTRGSRMATATATAPDDLDPDTQDAIEEAERILRPYAASVPAAADALEALSGEGGDVDDDAIAKARSGLAGVRAALAKSELGASDRFAAGERLTKADRQLQHEHMMKSSTGYAIAAANRAAEARLREERLGASL